MTAAVHARRREQAPLRSGCSPSKRPLGQQLGRIWRETDEENTDYETVIHHLLQGSCSNPVRVIAFNTIAGWSRDVSEDVADELRERCAERGEVPAFLADFLERHETGRPVQLLLPIAV